VGRTIHSDDYRTLLAVVREARESAGFTQATLATQLGRPQSWVSKVETGERRLDVAELRHVCDVLGIDLIEVIREWEARLQ
jgi:transcriptional regulator with XRE-family HTH domain